MFRIVSDTLPKTLQRCIRWHWGGGSTFLKTLFCSSITKKKKRAAYNIRKDTPPPEITSPKSVSQSLWTPVCLYSVWEITRYTVFKYPNWLLLFEIKILRCSFLFCGSPWENSSYQQQCPARLAWVGLVWHVSAWFWQGTGPSCLESPGINKSSKDPGACASPSHPQTANPPLGSCLKSVIATCPLLFEMSHLTKKKRK